MAGAPTITLTRATLTDLVIGQTSVVSALEAGTLTAPDGTGPLEAVLALLDRFDFWFEIVAP
jgi:alkyl sulfatase BDS1-like metallo-beta-lactamase superfamily hydrolase